VRFEHPAILYQLLVLVSGNENSTEAREEVQIFKGPGQSTPWTLWYRFPTSGEPGRVTYTVAALVGDATEQVLITSLTPGTGGLLSYRLIGADNGKPITLLSAQELRKGGAKVVGQTIETREAIYAAGEPNCCPSLVEVTVYGWDGKAFVVRRKERVPNQ